MFYTKNVPNWERVLRAIIGVVALAFAYLSWGTSTIGVMAALSSAGIALTGLVGFCPMCALVGRKL